ncbi:MAG: hypothetical protein HQ483_19185 [Rhodospirillales bacterium]|nr:hypothetical protein [Rhodospirillales bacterium]
MRPGLDLLVDSVDCHVHACPHINARSIDVLQAARAAAAAGMRSIGLMDNFSNSSGLAALARRELADLDIDIFGGLIMEPPAGGLSVDAVKIALAYGYDVTDGARFISLPTHHTRNIARQEGRDESYMETCLEIPEKGDLPDLLLEILDLIAAHDVVLNTGHISGTEACRLTEIAVQRGVGKILVPASHYEPDEVRHITDAGAYAEFSFFFMSHATQLGLTHVDAEKHTVTAVNLARMAQLINTATPARTVLSGDCGVYVLPPPVEGFREFLLMIESTGFDRDAMRQMSAVNPAALFKVPARQTSAN